MLQLSQLRCFVAVATELHFSRAAARLNMTQPPLTRQIQLLEHELGVTLLERNRRLVRLTPGGKAFFKEAQDILLRVQGAKLATRRAVDGTAGNVRLGFIPAASYSVLSDLIGVAREALPDIDLSLVEMQTLDQLEALSAGRLDLAIVRPLTTRPNLEAACILRDPFVLAAPSDHPLARARKLSLRHLDQQPLVMYAPADGQYLYELLLGLFRGASVVPTYVQYISHTHSMLSLVSAGLGVALVPKSAERMQFENVRFRPIDIGTDMAAELHLVWRHACDNPAAVTLREHVLAGL